VEDGRYIIRPCSPEGPADHGQLHNFILIYHLVHSLGCLFTPHQ
jgi:hypothetical protein